MDGVGYECACSNKGRMKHGFQYFNIEHIIAITTIDVHKLALGSLGS